MAGRANPSSPYQESPPPSPKDARRREPEMVGPFRLGRTLGRGMTGKVREGVHVTTGERVAVKILQKKMLREKNVRRRVKREVAILKLLQHPNITRLYDVRETKRHLFLIMELVEGGELFDFIVKKGKLPREEALRFVAQIVQGCEYAQHFGVCHRDLKPENVLMDAEGNLKIADFGMAQLVKDGTRCVTSCGSPHYASPQVISGDAYEGAVADVWSIGVILFALVTAMLPFDSSNIADLLERVQRGVYRMPDGVPPDIRDLIERMLVVDVDSRIRMADIKHHPCFRSAGKAVKMKRGAAVGGKTNLPAPGNLFFTADAYRHEEEGAEFEAEARQARLLADDLSPDVLFDLTGLGLGTTEELTDVLCRDGFSQSKALYFMLRRRRAQRSLRTGLCSPRRSQARRKPAAAAGLAGVPGAQVAAAVAAAALGASDAASPPGASSRRVSSSRGERGERSEPPGTSGGSGGGGGEGEAAVAAAVPFEKLSSAITIITGDGADPAGDSARAAASPSSRPAASAAAGRVRGRKPKLAVKVGLSGERAIAPGIGAGEGVPQYSRIRAVQDADDADDKPITPSKKKSWFAALFRRGSSSQVEQQ